MAMLALENVVKVYPGNLRAVDDVTLEVGDAELIVLVGPSGCGKTTTLRLIAGLERPTGGTISLAGRPLGGVAPKDRDVAMVFQESALYPHMSVAGNMAFGLKMRRTDRSEIRRRVARAADLLGIVDLLPRRPGQLSGGQRQRVALGRAIVRNPTIFLFDEPLSNLDAALRSQMRHEIRRLHARLGATTVYVTHDQTEAMTLGHRIAVLRDGRLQQVADPRTLYGRPANRFVAGLIGSPAMNFLQGRIERHGDQLAFRATLPESAGAGDGDSDQPGLSLPIPSERTTRLAPYTGRPVTMGLRPEHIGSAAAEQVPDAPRISATVEAVEPVGPESYVYLTAAAQTLVARVDAGRTLEVGEPARPAVAVDHLYFFDPDTERIVA